MSCFLNFYALPTPSKEVIITSQSWSGTKVSILESFLKMSESHLFWNEQKIKPSKFTAKRAFKKKIVSGHFACPFLKEKKGTYGHFIQIIHFAYIDMIIIKLN